MPRYRRKFKPDSTSSRNNKIKLNDKCSPHFTWLDLISCGETYENSDCENLPREPETWCALANLANEILEPTKKEFSNLKLTYCFASRGLTAQIPDRIAPRSDQHSSYELSSSGQRICKLGGAAVDFWAPGIDTRHLASFVIANVQFDSVYFYGDKRPLHVSWSEAPRRNIIEMRYSEKHTRYFPVKRTELKFLNIYG